MNSKSNAQAMETAKNTTSFGPACNTGCCGSNHQPFI